MGLVIMFCIAVIAVLLIIQGIMARKFESIAIRKGYEEESNIYAMCFWLGIVGYLYVIALPDQTKTVAERKALAEEKVVSSFMDTMKFRMSMATSTRHVITSLSVLGDKFTVDATFYFYDHSDSCIATERRQGSVIIDRFGNVGHIDIQL